MMPPWTLSTSSSTATLSMPSVVCCVSLKGEGPPWLPRPLTWHQTHLPRSRSRLSRHSLWICPHGRRVTAVRVKVKRKGKVPCTQGKPQGEGRGMRGPAVIAELQAAGRGVAGPRTFVQHRCWVSCQQCPQRSEVSHSHSWLRNLPASLFLSVLQVKVFCLFFNINITNEALQIKLGKSL